MSELNQIPTDYKKLLDATLYKYLPKIQKIRPLFNQINVDPGQVTLEYVRKTQTYAAAKGWTSFDDPLALADGASPRMDSLGTEDATSSPTTYAKGFRLDRKLLNSGLPIIQSYIAEHAVDMANIMENYVNRSLLTSMASTAAQSYTATGGTWATTGDPVSDVMTAKTNFEVQADGVAADFVVLNPTNYNDLAKDTRFQSTLYTNSATVLPQGTIVPKPFGLEFVTDPAVTSGTFFMGKKGMFADIMIGENYKTFEVDEGAAGKKMESVFTFVAQFKLPYYLLYGTGI